MVLAHQNQNTYGEMLNKMCAVVFLGVPHCGANAANMAHFAATLLQFAQLGLRTNPAYVRALQRNSETLAQITGQFVQRAVQLHIRTFFETETIAGHIVGFPPPTFPSHFFYRTAQIQRMTIDKFADRGERIGSFKSSERDRCRNP